jgi:hypothetical protein
VLELGNGAQDDRGVEAAVAAREHKDPTQRYLSRLAAYQVDPDSGGEPIDMDGGWDDSVAQRE